MSERHVVPPQDIEAEAAVLGSMMLSPTALDDCQDVLAPGDFYRPAHEAICMAIYALAAKREPVDAVTVSDELQRQGNLTRVGGPAYLHQLVNSVPNAASATFYAGIVVDKATRRRLVEAATRVLQMAQAEGTDTDSVVALAEQEVGQVSATRNRVRLRPLADTLEHTLEMLDSDGPLFAPTPWPDLDEHIHGWRPGALHTIAARPGGGKSLLGLQAALYMAKTGKAVTYAAMEMDTDELNIRILAQSANVGMDSLSKARLSAMEWEKVSNSVPALMGLPLYVDDVPYQTLAHIRAQARAVARRTELGMIVVDYVQQIESPQHLQQVPRHQQVGTITRGLKNLAREMSVPVLAMCQVSRGPADRQDKAPTLYDLRESGSIEADSDVVIALHRQSYDDPEVECYVRKARQGREGHFKLGWQAHFARLVSHVDPYGRQTA